MKRTFPVLGASLALTALVSALIASACGTDVASVPGDPKLRAKILKQLGEKVILPELRRFETAAKDLEEAIAVAAKNPEDPPTATQPAFEAALRQWQLLEMMQLGPLAPMSRGGDDLRDEIYSWPVANTCRVDQALAKAEYADEDALAEDTINARGLDALEHLLFTEGTENTCASTIDINEDGSWEALTADELARRRLDYSSVVAALIVEKASQAVKGYSPDGADFVAELATAGQDGSRYASSQDAFNDWAEALFYLDLQVKDMKLGEPAGIQECPLSQCDIELPVSNLSTEAISQNLASFDLQFFGGARPDDGPGLDDLLIDLGQDELADRMEKLIDDARNEVSALPSSVAVAIDEDPKKVQAAYDAIKALTDVFETEVFSVLSLELPDSGASDSD